MPLDALAEARHAFDTYEGPPDIQENGYPPLLEYAKVAALIAIAERLDVLAEVARTAGRSGS